ncbi:MAG TPA: hypothetical protein VLA52_01355 [Thermohalobaculum sp.]|nr:hypothetical protein [Thermohalobaculum sp.]
MEDTYRVIIDQVHTAAGHLCNGVLFQASNAGLPDNEVLAAIEMGIAAALLDVLEAGLKPGHDPATVAKCLIDTLGAARSARGAGVEKPILQ